MSDQLPGEGTPDMPHVPEGPTPPIPESPSHESPTELPIAPPTPEQPTPVEPSPTQPTPGTTPPVAPHETSYAPPTPGVPFGNPIPPMSAPPTDFASNYPRAGMTILGYVRPPGVYWDSIGTAFSMITSNVGTYLLSTLLVIATMVIIYITFIPFVAGSMMTAFSSGLQPGASPFGGKVTLMLVLPSLLSNYILAFTGLCLVSVGVRQAQGHFSQISDYFIPYRNLKVSALAALLIAAPQMILSLLSSLLQFSVGTNPGIAFVVAMASLPFTFLIYLCLTGQLLLSGTAAVFSGDSPIEKAKTLYTRLGWQSLMFGLLFMLSAFLSYISIFFLCIPFLFFCPLFSNVIAIHVVYNFPEDQTPANVPAYEQPRS